MHEILIKISNENRLMTLTKENIVNSLTHATRDKYAKNIKRFQEWCNQTGCSYLPASAEMVARYLSHEADIGKKVNTLNHRLLAIKILHETNGYISPTHNKGVQAAFEGIKRKYGTKLNKKAPITIEKLEKMLAHCSSDAMGLRDRALLAIGFAGAFRRSELVRLTIEDITRTKEGIKIMIRKSKTDQVGCGQTVAILNGERLRVVDILDDWLKMSGITSGYIFRSISKKGVIKNSILPDQMVGLIVKKYISLAKIEGFDNFSGHSLRAGFITTAAQNGAGIQKIMEVSRHSSIEVLLGYVREAKLFTNHAGESFM